MSATYDQALAQKLYIESTPADSWVRNVIISMERLGEDDAGFATIKYKPNLDQFTIHWNSSSRGKKFHETTGGTITTSDPNEAATSYNSMLTNLGFKAPRFINAETLQYIKENPFVTLAIVGTARIRCNFNNGELYVGWFGTNQIEEEHKFFGKDDLRAACDFLDQKLYEINNLGDSI